MTRPELVFVSTGTDGAAELVVNFGVYSGREATPAEVQRLAHALLEHVPAVEVVGEHRYEFSRDAEATVYRLRIFVPGAGARAAELRDTVAAWAEDCIDERYVAP
ncbi:MAG: hypothetical protein ACRDNR_05445 [Gaiellaceae bacterium]